jgi:hypothetical protein
MIELVKISENISRSFNGKETVETLQAVNYRIVENGVEKGHVTVGQGSFNMNVYSMTSTVEETKSHRQTDHSMFNALSDGSDE